MSIITALTTRITRRPPDFMVDANSPQGASLNRWYVWPRNRFVNLYLHQFLRSDDDFALHDHPWLFNASRIVKGFYFENTIKEGGVYYRDRREEGSWKFRWGPSPHRVELDVVDGKNQECWTLFMTGPIVREWGFHCPKRWMSFKEKKKRIGNSSDVAADCPG